MSDCVRVATINLLCDASRWAERRPLLASGLARWRPDLIAVQEVVNPRRHSTAHQLADDLGGYRVVAAPKVGWFRDREGIAVLSRLPIVSHEVIALSGEGRVAQFVDVEVGRTRFVLAHAHYLFRPFASPARTRQVRHVLAHLRATVHRIEHAGWRSRSVDPEVRTALCGDFNDVPGSGAITAVREGFASAHEVYHDHEPE